MLNRRGVTLIELLVVCLLVGILAAFGVPAYLRSVENSKADDGSALVNMMGTANRMFALDHQQTYAVGAVTNACNGAVACPAAGPYNGCALVYCHYIGAMDFNSKPYTFSVDNPGGNSVCAYAGGGNTACGRRAAGANPPYSGWFYGIKADGTWTIGGGAPQPVQ